MKGKKPPKLAVELDWWRRRIVKIGGVVGALVILASAVGGGARWVGGRYALAADVQQIQSDVLELRRDNLDAERRELLRFQRTRALTDPEINRLQKVNDLIHELDRRLQKLQDKK